MWKTYLLGSNSSLHLKRIQKSWKLSIQPQALSDLSSCSCLGSLYGRNKVHRTPPEIPKVLFIKKYSIIYKLFSTVNISFCDRSQIAQLIEMEPDIGLIDDIFIVEALQLRS